ncbi:MAG TPA: MobF family relaxase [Acidimicrobiales bacterium]|nr:MobF family relaxase [Acidimicrobiales bacterium]
MITSHDIGAGHLGYYTGWADLVDQPGIWWTQDEGAFGVACGEPVDKERLVGMARGQGSQARKDRHPGIDFVFSAPKSVSLLAFGHPDAGIRDGVTAAHHAALTSTLAWLERHGLVTRRTVKGEVERLPVRGIYALFDHSTSRAGDPQLHTHCLAINLGADASGRLGAIDRYVLNKYKIPAGSIYRLALRAELAKLGLAFEPPNASGLAELRGMPAGLLRHYSTRRREIEAHLDAQILDTQVEDSAGSPGTGLRRSAAVATRTKKPTGRSAAESEDVSARLRPLFADTVDPWLWDQVFGTPSAPAPIDPARASQVIGQLLGPDGPLYNMSSWSRHSLIARLAAVLPEGATPEEVDRLVELIEADDSLVPLVYVDPSGVVATRASVGDLRLAVATEVDRSVSSTLGLRHASKALVAEEHAILVAAATWSWPTGQPERVVTEKVLAGAAGGDLPPTTEQAELVRHFVGSDRAITLGVGVPGSGKTTAMCLCVEAWKRLSTPVIALSFKGKSALELSRASGVTSSTVDRFLARLHHGRVSVAPGSVILVDEASELSTRRLSRLVRVAAQHRAKLVLLGDDRQRQSIEAGGMFATLVRENGAAVLSRNVRQRTDYEREAVGLLRRGQSEAAFALWASAGHFRAASRYEDLLSLTIDGWLTDRASSPSSVMMAHSNIEAASLSDLAHQALIDRGVLDRKPLLVVGGTTGSAIRAYHRGDRIVFTRNDSMLAIRDASRAKVGSVLNGMVGTVVAYNHVFNTLVTEVEGGTVALPLAYAEAHTAYGYAFTVAKLQSSTISGRAQVFRPETLSAADFLVAASRATDGTTFNFLATPGGAAGEGHPAAEWDEATPGSYLTGLLASLATRLDRESISVGASSVLLAQSEAQRLAGVLGPHGTSAYRAMWSRLATGKDVYSAARAERDRLSVALRVERVEQLRDEVAAGGGAPDQLAGAIDNLAVAQGIALTSARFEHATRKGLRPDRRYAAEQVQIARMACLYAEAAGQGEAVTEPSADPSSNPVYGVSFAPFSDGPVSEGILDVQELPDTGRPLSAEEGLGTMVVTRHPEAVLGPPYATLRRSGVLPTPEVLVEAAESGPEELRKVLGLVGDVLGPRWADQFATQLATHGRARGWEFTTRPQVASLVSRDLPRLPRAGGASPVAGPRAGEDRPLPASR